jgi:hypothetical protein
MVFAGGALLEEEPATTVTDDDGDGTMTAPSPMGLELGHGVERAVVPVDENDLIERRIDGA